MKTDYIVTNIKSEKRSFRKALNHGLASNVNEIEISLERPFKIFGIVVSMQKRIASGAMDVKYDINNYLKKGDLFDCNIYPTLKITKQ